MRHITQLPTKRMRKLEESNLLGFISYRAWSQSYQ